VGIGGDDGHKFHERTPEQVSADRRRERDLQRLGLPLLRFNGTEIVRDKPGAMWEIATFVYQKPSEKQARLAETAEREAEYTELMYRRYGSRPRARIRRPSRTA
jgi:hypothetical protein